MICIKKPLLNHRYIMVLSSKELYDKLVIGLNRAPIIPLYKHFLLGNFDTIEKFNGLSYLIECKI